MAYKKIMRFILVCFLSMVLLNAQNWNQPKPNHQPNHQPNNYQSKPAVPNHQPNNYQKPAVPNHQPNNYQKPAVPNHQPNYQKPVVPNHQPVPPKPVVEPKPEPKKQSFWSWLFGIKEEPKPAPKPAPRKYRFQHKDWTNTFDLADLNHDGYVSPEEYRRFHEKHHHEKYYKTDEGADLLDFLVDVFKSVTGVGISRDEWNRRSPHYKH